MATSRNVVTLYEETGEERHEGRTISLDELKKEIGGGYPEWIISVSNRFGIPAKNLADAYEVDPDIKYSFVGTKKRYLTSTNAKVMLNDLDYTSTLDSISMVARETVWTGGARFFYTGDYSWGTETGIWTNTTTNQWTYKYHGMTSEFTDQNINVTQDIHLAFHDNIFVIDKNMYNASPGYTYRRDSEGWFACGDKIMTRWIDLKTDLGRQYFVPFKKGEVAGLIDLMDPNPETCFHGNANASGSLTIELI